MGEWNGSRDNINRNGRPVKELALTTILKDRGEIEDVETAEGKLARKVAIAEKLWSMAMSGDIAALKYVYDRIDGKAMQKMQVSNDKDSEWLELMKGIAGETVTETGEDT